MRPMPPLTEMVAAFYEVDKLLFTAESHELHRRSEAHHMPQTWLDFRDQHYGIWRLSDGGDSRIYVTHIDAGEIWLGRESTKRAKERWELPEVQEAVQALRKTLLKLEKQYTEEHDE